MLELLCEIAKEKGIEQLELEQIMIKSVVQENRI